MWPLLKSLVSPFLSLVLMIIASGLFNTFVSIRLEMEGVSSKEIGIVVSSLYFGILLGSFRIDRWISKVGHTRSFISFALALALLTLAQSLWINPWYWSFLRLLGGVCMAGVFIVIESWLLIQSGPKLRGAILSIYLAIFYAALSSGQFLINASDPASQIPFLITAALLALSIIPVAISKVGGPKLSASSPMSLSQLYRISPLGFMGGVISGVMLAVIYGLVPLYAKSVGMSLSEIGTFMAVIIFGGFTLQLPFGKLADKTDRRKVLNWASFIAAFLAIAIGLFHEGSLYLLYLMAGIFGGFSFTLYPLSMAYACERLKEEQIVAATGGFVLSYGLGAIVGPLLAPLAMQFLGSGGLFYFLGINAFILGLIGLKKPAPALLDEEE
jgi:MFS family permease